MEATHTHPLEGISVVLPLYNEEENITSVFTELSDVLQGLGRLHEIICVNDGSTDGSKVELEKQARISESDIKLIHFEQNRGQRAAFAAGFENARFPLVVTMDADGQNDPADIPRLLEGITDADVCCGVRFDRKDTWSKRIGSQCANRVRNLLLKSDIQDTGCSLKVFRTDMIRALPFWDGMHRFLPDLCRIHSHARICQIPVSHRPRLKGKSKYNNLGRLCKTLPDVLSVRRMKQ